MARARKSMTTLALTVAVVGLAAPAMASPPPPVEVVAGGLDDPTGLRASGGKLYVAESASGEVSSIDRRRGTVTALVTGLAGPSSADVARGKLLALTGGGQEGPTPQPGTATLFTADRHGGPATVLADLHAYELAHNPDGQPYTAPDGTPVMDSVSNPYSVIVGRHGDRAYVADAGANDVLSVDRHGKVSTFAVLPVIKDGECATRPENDPATFGCDPVPTGLAYGPRGELYVSALAAEAPGQGRVFVLDSRTGKVLRTLTGFDSPTGVAVDGRGNVYVSEAVWNAPPIEGPGDLPSGFDPASVGRIVKVDRNGKHPTYAKVPQPVGIVWADGSLYSTSYSLMASFLQEQGAGQVVKVSQSAFGAAW